MGDISGNRHRTSTNILAAVIAATIFIGTGFLLAYPMWLLWLVIGLFSCGVIGLLVLGFVIAFLSIRDTLESSHG